MKNLLDQVWCLQMILSRISCIPRQTSNCCKMFAILVIRFKALGNEISTTM